MTKLEDSRPNLLLITVDQMRGDCLSILDHPVVETPNLDQLARRGMLFRNAYSSTPTCVPARAALFTGMSPRSHGRVGYEEKVPWNYEHTLPGELAKAGYHTQCVGKMHVDPARSLLGFHNVVLHDGYLHHNRFKHTNTVTESHDSCDDYLPWLRERAGASTDLIDLGLDCNSSTIALPWHLPEALHPTNWVVTQSIDFCAGATRESHSFFGAHSFGLIHRLTRPRRIGTDMSGRTSLIRSSANGRCRMIWLVAVSTP